MPNRLLLDTDVAIDYLRGLPQALTYLESRSEPLLLSSITVAELFVGVREGEERLALEAFLTAFEIISVDEMIAQQSGLLRRDFGKSHNTGLADALIAATAKQTHAQLATGNLKHFPMTADVIVPYQK